MTRGKNPVYVRGWQDVERHCMSTGITENHGLLEKNQPALVRKNTIGPLVWSFRLFYSRSLIFLGSRKRFKSNCRLVRIQIKGVLRECARWGAVVDECTYVRTVYTRFRLG